MAKALFDDSQVHHRQVRLFAGMLNTLPMLVHGPRRRIYEEYSAIWYTYGPALPTPNISTL